MITAIVLEPVRVVHVKEDHNMINNMKFYICIMLLSICGSVCAEDEAEKVPHLRTFLRNANWVMQYVTDSVIANGCDSTEEFISAGPIIPHTAISTTDRYFSNAEVQITTCAIRFTINSTIQDMGSSYHLPVPSAVKGKKILLTPDAVPAITGWTCQTDIDAGLNNLFQGASAQGTGDPSIISFFPENLFVGNCVYVATPW